MLESTKRFLNYYGARAFSKKKVGPIEITSFKIDFSRLLFMDEEEVIFLLRRSIRKSQMLLKELEDKRNNRME
jgi:hypothetical protein